MTQNENITTTTMENSVETPAFAPAAVQATDFPQPTSRLQELMKEYRPAVPVATPTSSPLSKVEVVSELAMMTFDDLKPEDKQKVLARISAIDYTSSVDIQNFGSVKDSKLTKYSEVIISKYTSEEYGDLADPITDLVANLKTKDTKAVLGMVKFEEPSKNMTVGQGIREFNLLKKTKKKMYKLLANHDSIKKNLDTVRIELKKQQVSLQNDVQVYEGMTYSSFDLVGELELDCIALDLMIEDAQKKREAIVSKGKITQYEALDARKYESAVERMIRRKQSIMAVRVTAVQNVPMLAGIIKGNEIIVEKIDEIESLVIPMWMQQYAIAIGHIKQKEALSFQQTIRNITNYILTNNAKMLHDNIIRAQAELYTAVVSIETLEEVQRYLDDMVTTVNAKSKEAINNCLANMKTMREIEQKNYQLMSQNLLPESN